ncbi:ASCH domain-containing protein [Xylophilus ampelinus]|uniref:ASCH domain-containing protein n=1 Tax=Xylophilus ampelinus TaxID=54067 RepID=A0A318SQF1_9BURK|nr:ASCH domain-containing protein [Xylophilus ampelinus]MCS4509172.1 ASCH domain-containing protein [Xylophilus ampelinus]PYE79802.1 ASCH domain-containing protein [Xylophilus ampelinus]
MKALSIRQPWAWLIVNGHKPVENRTWETLRRGPILIHAGQAMTRADHDDCIQFLASDPRIAHVIGLLPHRDAYERGGIVGRAQLVGCQRTHESPYFFGPFGFVLTDAQPLPFAPYKGALGFFNVPGVLP